MPRETAAKTKTSGRRWLKLLRFAFYIWLVSTPLTLVPQLTGAISGLLLTHWHSTEAPRNTAALHRELDIDDELARSTKPGEPGSFDFERGPFYNATQIRTIDWFVKLGFRKDHRLMGPDVGIDSSGNLEGLYWSSRFAPAPFMPGSETQLGMLPPRARKTADGRASRLASKWLYVTDDPVPDSDDYDLAFVQLLEYHAANPPVDGAKFFYLNCKRSGFLCGLWSVRKPSLIHFTVDLDMPYMIGAIRPVALRIVELPLYQWTAFPGAFPYPLEQLRALTTGAYDLDESYQYDSMKQYLYRFYDYQEEFVERHNTTLGRLFRLKERMAGYYPLFHEKQSLVATAVQLVDYVTFFFTMVVGVSSAFIYYRALDLAAWLFKTPPTFDPTDPTQFIPTEQNPGAARA